MSYPKRAFLALPMTRLEIPGWGKVARALQILVPVGSRRWDGAPHITIRGKSHGFLMRLDLSDWSERMTYFLGRYYELTLQQLLDVALQPGDRFVDIGGNIGMITLLAVKAVGPSGRVQTFEPNTACVARIREVLDMNGVSNVEIIAKGLSDKAEELTLSVADSHTGVGTFAPIDPDHPSVTDRATLPLVTGDSVLLADTTPIRMVKIDVEGFEVKAVNGLAKTIERDHPMIVTEIIDEQLRRAGASASELFDLITRFGYEGYGLRTRRRGLRHELELVRAPDVASATAQSDVLWLKRGKPDAESLLERYLV